jgi:hypothetical protein
MKYLKHGVASLVLFSVLLLLILNPYKELQENYNFTNADEKTLVINNETYTGGVAEQLKNLQLNQGIEQISNNLLKLNPGTGSLADILGALAGVGLGSVKTVLGLFVVPYQISNIIVTFYAGEIPGAIVGLLTMVIVYGGFILLGAYIGREI